MKSQVVIYLVLIGLFMTGCFKKPALLDSHKDESQKVEPYKTEDSDAQTLVIEKMEPAPTKVQVGHLNKVQREALYFAASLEREAMKLITKNSYYDKGTLFSVLSYIFETNAGVKKMFPSNIDCSRFRLQKQGNTLLIYRTCQKPETLVAEFKLKMQGSEFDIEFKTREWSAVVGTPVALTNADVRCQLVIKAKRLESVDCQNWTYVVQEDNFSATEVRLKNFTFDRKNSLQFHLKGGFFKDLVEFKKIAIMIPMEGKIKLIEKEIEVIDDFAERPRPLVAEKPKHVKPYPLLKPITLGAPNGQTQKQENGQEINGEIGYEKSQAVSQDGSPSSHEGSQDGQVSPEKSQQEIEQNTEHDENNGGVPRIPEADRVPEAPNRSR